MKQMQLDEALTTLNNAGFICEGRLGRAIGIGALALGSLFNHGHSATEQENFRNAKFQELSIEQQKKYIENLHTGTNYVKVKANYIVRNGQGGNTFYITKDIPGIPSDVTSITFISDNTGMLIFYEDGSSTFYTLIPDYENRKYVGVVKEFDEFDTEIKNQEVSSEELMQNIRQIYNLLMQNK